ncbi:hypothetical protein KAR02_05015, partial [Candidatus Bipolaricaulota bacterium]|nr:hypothetical protein [Candidatus Bipolaricaulota bacterium]
EGCSSRADVSRFRWRNVYNFGDFGGSADTLLKYYDAHFYIANWGTVRFAVAFPDGCLSQEAIQPYLRGNDRYEETLSVKSSDGRCIVCWERNEEEGWGWTEGDGSIDPLIGIREELMRGDYRALFLGWLADFRPDEWRDPRDTGVLVPPVPAALDYLTPALQALIEQFPVDPDALAVAAGQSRDAMLDRIPIPAVLDKLPVPEMKTLLQRVAEGDGSRVTSELNRLTYPPVETPTGEGMTCVDFATKAIEVREARLKKEARAEAAERKRAAAACKRHLESIMKRADTIWAGLDPLMDQKIASAYDNAAAQLKELRDAYKQADKNTEFQDRFVIFREHYARRPAMMRRIKEL